MRVSEIKEIAPVDDVYEFKPDARYLIKIPARLEQTTIASLADTLKLAGIKAILFDGSVTFYEMTETPAMLK